ncbi:MAG: undecaprenyl-phosphate glucose phosphotransferase, partial [Gammaproteobacteria bacterium]
MAESLVPSILHRSAIGLSFSSRALSVVIAAADALCVFAMGIALYAAYLGWSSSTYPTYVVASGLGSLLLVAVLNQSGHYTAHYGDDLLRHAKGVLATWAGVFLTLVLAAYALKISANVSRLWSFAWFASTLVWLLIQRALLWQFIRRAAVQGKLAQRTVILGAGAQGERLLKHLKQRAEPWIAVTGVFDDRTTRIQSSIMGFPVLGNMDDLLHFVGEHRVDNVLVAFPWAAERRLAQVIDRLRELAVDVYLVPEAVGQMHSEQGFNFIARTPMLQVVSRPLNGWRRMLKEVEDQLLAFPLILLLMPIMLVIALAIKLDSKGPVLYRQQRRGLNKKPFEILKFRTMYEGRGENHFRQARRNDVRVTRVGRFLRRTSLDELPQLLNVLKGDMSLIGPRPHPIPLDDQFAPRIDGYFARNRVKPGITGWAQVNGFRGETATLDKMEGRVSHDNY